MDADRGCEDVNWDELARGGQHLLHQGLGRRLLFER
jgi:hypothetical protein